MNSLSMGGPLIGKDDIPVDAVRQLNNGTPVFISQHGSQVKMVTGPPWSKNTPPWAAIEDARYYAGTIAEFSQAKWDAATKVGPGNYLGKPVYLKKTNGRPANAYTNSMVGKCTNDAGTPAKGTTLLAVQNECALQDTCTGYSYNTNTGNYTLHTTDLTTGDGQVDWRCVPKAMIGVCRTEDQKEVPWSTFPGSYAECATKCMDDPKCQAYGFKGLNNTCLIHGVGPNPGNATPGARVTSTNLSVPVWSCVVKTGRKGAPVSTPVAVAPTPTPVTPVAPTPVAPAIQVQMATPAPAPAPVTPAAPTPSVQVQMAQMATPAPAGPAPVTPAVSTSSPAPSLVPTPVIPAPTPAFPSAVSAPQVPAPAPSGPELNDNWMCISDFSAPVKRFGNDVGCLTLDGKTCLYDYCSKPDSKFPANPQSLICGNDYKSKLGVSGYESPDGWCSKVNRVLPGGTPTPLPVSAPALQPVAPTATPTAAQTQTQTQTQTQLPALPPAFTPSVAFTDLGMGLCRTSGMEYPAYEQRQIGEPECLNACQQDMDCMGYAMSSDGYCQLYNVKSATVPRSAKVGDMLEKVDGNPSWKCKVKTPKVSIAGQLLDTLSSDPLPPTQANQQFDDVLLSQAANTPSLSLPVTSTPSTLTSTPSTSTSTPSTLTSTLSSSLMQLPSFFYPSASSAPLSSPPTTIYTAPTVSAPTVTRTPTQVLGAVTNALYAPQIQAYNACSAYFNKQSGGAKAKAKAAKAKPSSSKPYASSADSAALSKAAIDYQRNVLRASLARR